MSVENQTAIELSEQELDLVAGGILIHNTSPLSDILNKFPEIKLLNFGGAVDPSYTNASHAQ